MTGTLALSAKIVSKLWRHPATTSTHGMAPGGLSLRHRRGFVVEHVSSAGHRPSGGKPARSPWRGRDGNLRIGVATYDIQPKRLLSGSQPITGHCRGPILLRRVSSTRIHQQLPHWSNGATDVTDAQCQCRGQSTTSAGAAIATPSRIGLWDRPASHVNARPKNSRREPPGN